MKTKITAAAIAAAFLFCFSPAWASNHSRVVTCTPTGVTRDSINMTTANGAGTYKGQTLSGAGCNITLYTGPHQSSTVTSSDISGSNYFGILVNGGTVTIEDDSIHDIGETPLNGSQHGIGIACVNDGNQTSTVIISGNRLWNYQKNGMAISSDCKVNIIDNTVTGLGPVSFIAQNGIELDGVQSGVVYGNTISGHAYTGAGEASSGGILLLGGPGFGLPLQQGNKVTNNTLSGNDVGFFDYNLDQAGTGAVTTASNDTISTNVLVNNFVTNTTGDGSAAYQVAISAIDNKTTMSSNGICGNGYLGASPPGGLVAAYDLSGSIKITPTPTKPNCPLPTVRGTTSSRVTFSGARPVYRGAVVALHVSPSIKIKKRH